VPALEQILTALLEYPEREVYLDFKQVDLEKLATLIQQYGVAQQIIFTHRDHENCKAIKRLVPSIRTMLWITGTVQEDTISKFEAAFNSGFEGLDIIQIHLVDADQREGWRYRVQREYLESAHQRLEQKGLELEVLPYQFEDSTLFELLDLGIRRFAVDEPKVFIEALQRYGES
jgi:glycerophosphoryl diester phosphodiesterase